MLNLIPISRSLRAACVAVVLTTAFVALAAAPAAADVASDFDSSIASTGVIPDIDGLNTNGGFIILNTNNGDIYTTGYNLVTPVAGQSELVTEAGGGTAMLFNFSTFTVPTGTTVLIQGSRPAIISATGNITIDGTVDASPDSYCLFSGGSGCTPPPSPGRGPLRAGRSGGRHSWRWTGRRELKQLRERGNRNSASDRRRGGRSRHRQPPALAGNRTLLRRGSHRRRRWRRRRRFARAGRAAGRAAHRLSTGCRRRRWWSLQLGRANGRRRRRKRRSVGRQRPKRRQWRRRSLVRHPGRSLDRRRGRY